MTRAQRPRFAKLPDTFFKHPFFACNAAYDRGHAMADLAALAAFAAHERNYTGATVPLEPGDFAVTMRSLARRWKWSKSRVVRFLEKLIADGLVTRKRIGKRDSHPSVFHIEATRVYRTAGSQQRDAHRDNDESGERDTHEDIFIEVSSLRGSKEESGRSPILGSNGDQLHDPRDLAALWNDRAPHECPQVSEMTTGRLSRATAAIAAHPERKYWDCVFAQLKRSNQLRGRVKSKFHWVADFDWLISEKEGTANYVRVAEGKYQGPRMRDPDEDEG
jgi:hypothetical protein